MNLEEKELYSARADVLKALAHPARLWMVDQLLDKEICVCDFVTALKLDVSTVSKHLTVLKNAGIVISDKRGKWVYYRLSLSCTDQFSACLDVFMNERTSSQLKIVEENRHDQ